MSTDIRVQISFSRHVKRRKLQSRLKADGVLALLDLWLYAGENHPDGTLEGMTDEDIALAVNWKGKPETLTKTLVDIGFMENVEGVYILHDWEDHNPFVVHAPERKERAKLAAKARWSMREACGKHTDSMQDAMLNQENRNAPSPSPTPIPIPIPKPNPNHKTTSAKDGKQPVDNSPEKPAIEKPALPEKGQDQNTEVLKPDPEPEINFSDFDPPRKPDKKNLLNGLQAVVDKCAKRFDSYGQRQIMLFVEANIRGKHPDAIKHCLESLLHQVDDLGQKIDKPRAYLEAALKIEDGVYNARDSEKISEEFKKPLPGGIETLGKVLQGIGKGART